MVAVLCLVPAQNPAPFSSHGQSVDVFNDPYHLISSISALSTKHILNVIYHMSLVRLCHSKEICKEFKVRYHVKEFDEFELGLSEVFPMNPKLTHDHCLRFSSGSDHDRDHCLMSTTANESQLDPWSLPQWTESAAPDLDLRAHSASPHPTSSRLESASAVTHMGQNAFFMVGSSKTNGPDQDEMPQVRPTDKGKGKQKADPVDPLDANVDNLAPFEDYDVWNYFDNDPQDACPSKADNKRDTSTEKDSSSNDEIDQLWAEDGGPSNEDGLIYPPDSSLSTVPVTLQEDGVEGDARVDEVRELASGSKRKGSEHADDLTSCPEQYVSFCQSTCNILSIHSFRPGPSTSKRQRFRSPHTQPDFVESGEAEVATADDSNGVFTSHSDTHTYEIPSRYDDGPGSVNHRQRSIRLSVPNSCRVTFDNGNITVMGSNDDNGRSDRPPMNSLSTQSHTPRGHETVDLTNDDDSDVEVMAVRASLASGASSTLDSTGATFSQASSSSSATAPMYSQTASQTSFISTSTATAQRISSSAEHEPLSAYTCPICFSAPTNATLTPCGHICCGECLFTAVAAGIQRAGNAPGAVGIGAGRRLPGMLGLGIGGGGGGGIVAGVGGDAARCPVCRAVLKGWDGRGGGVIGLKVKTKTVISV